MFNFGSLAVQDDDLFDQFQDDLEESGSLPYVQIINAGGKNAKLLDKNPLGFGIAISADNAQAVGFRPDVNWTEGEDIPIHPQSTATIEHGWVAQKINLVVLHSSQIEVQEKVNDRWRFLGVAWESNSRTKWGQLFEDSKDDKDCPYRQVKRFLLMFLGEDGQPLHDRPLQLTAKGAFRVSLNSEVQAFQKELGAAYREASRVAGKKASGAAFSKSAAAYIAMPMTVGYHIPKDADKSAFTCIVARHQPVNGADKTGKTATLDQNDRKVQVTGGRWSDYMIPKTSELGQVIRDLFLEFEAFPAPNRGMGAADSDTLPNGDVAYNGAGFIDAATLNLNTDGSATALFMTEKGSVPLIIPAEHIGAIDHTNLKVQGVIPTDGGPVTVTAWEGESVAQAVAVEPVAEQQSLVAAGDW
ncbi:hypothetical protein H6F75_00335 [Nodosilinea sp. FACHB-131]|uniref:DUF5895 domain-containing protein n=1 Tax=Cyanophyceae TaxID=3028117 RepID=UPI0016873A8C|nr:DUF5895 domain-containing protein [Nodosilinea sp. FACHB-131]MBD1871917.1 hypothetical protein [Nodosilinea sp. FACHB-131]